VNAVYGISLVIGVLSLISWILIGGFAEANDGRPFHPDERFGAIGRGTVAAFTAFGIGGLSASFGGWPTAAALVAALVAAAALGLYAARYDTGAESDAD
jgi:hypothetical protein